MHILTIFLALLVAKHSLATVVSHSDPSACQRIIKFMLINACGATKREFRTSPLFTPMSEEEIERRYHDMVLKHKIKGVGKNYDEKNAWIWDTMNDILNADNNEIQDSKPRYQRIKRSVIGMGLHMKNYAEAIDHERRGSFHFIGRLPSEREDRDDRSPPPGELKAKCCGGVILCTMDDFRGFCE